MKKCLLAVALLLALCLGACNGENNAVSSLPSSEDSDTVQSSGELTSTDESSVETGITEETAEETTEETTEGESTEAVSEDARQYLSFTPHYVRTGYDAREDLPYGVMLDSAAELTSYYLTHKSSSGLYDDFKKAISAYDVEFFGNKVVVLVALMENSGSIKHEVKEAYLEDGALILDIKCEIPQVVTDDMAGWHIIIELDKKCITAKDNIVINFSY